MAIKQVESLLSELSRLRLIKTARRCDQLLRKMRTQRLHHTEVSELMQMEYIIMRGGLT